MPPNKRTRLNLYAVDGKATFGSVKLALASSSRRVRAAVANDDALAIADTSHLFVRAELPLKSGGTRTWTFYHPVKLVQYVLEVNTNLADMYFAKLQESPSSNEKPWRIQLGCDEHVPGSKLNADNQRKNMVIVFNFIELGHDILEVDASWFVPVVVRETMYKDVKGGWSTLLRIFLRYLLLGPSSFTTGGVLVRCGVDITKLQASLQTCLTDGEGLMKCLEWNGHASLRPCFVHNNVFMKGSGMADPALGFVEITCPDPAQLRQYTADQWHANVDRVLEGRRQYTGAVRGDITNLQKLITAAGFKCTDHGLLADRELRLQCDFLKLWKYDWMHSVFQDGFMSNALWLVCSNISDGIGDSACESLVSHLRKFQFPISKASVGRQLYRAFAPLFLRRHRNKQAIVANASWQITLYPLVRDWALLEAEGKPELHEHVAVFLAACDIIDKVMLVKHRRMTTARAKPLLIAAATKWFDLHLVQYGTENVKPKSFWLRAIIDRFDDSEWLFDMFYIERQHQRVRPHAELVRNTTCFEESVLMRVLDAQLCILASPINLKPSLVGRQVQLSGGGFMADACFCLGSSFHADDVVFSVGIRRCGVITACISSGGRCILRVEVMRHVRNTIWQPTSAEEFWLASDAYLAWAWRKHGDTDCLVVL